MQCHVIFCSKNCTIIVWNLSLFISFYHTHTHNHSREHTQTDKQHKLWWSPSFFLPHMLHSHALHCKHNLRISYIIFTVNDIFFINNKVYSQTDRHLQTLLPILSVKSLLDASFFLLLNIMHTLVPHPLPHQCPLGGRNPSCLNPVPTQTIQSIQPAAAPGMQHRGAPPLRSLRHILLGPVEENMLYVCSILKKR